MFTHKDIEYRTIYVVNCVEERNLRVSNGEMLLEEVDKNTKKCRTLTKLPFQKILALFVIGNITITTPLLDKCKRFNVALVVMRQNLRPIFYWSDAAEANFLLRKRQYELGKDDVYYARFLICNKISNQRKLLRNTRKKDMMTNNAIDCCVESIKRINDGEEEYGQLMGLEGVASKMFFAAYFQGLDWKMRCPRVKCDALNATLDIGYTILFNFVECYLRMFGFDLYVGVFHRMWFKRKSLVCDLMEPWRCVVDATVRSCWNRKQMSEKDFKIEKGEWRLKNENIAKYNKMFYDALISYKSEMFVWIQRYYRFFMKGKKNGNYTAFNV